MPAACMGLLDPIVFLNHSFDGIRGTLRTMAYCAVLNGGLACPRRIAGSNGCGSRSHLCHLTNQMLILFAGETGEALEPMAVITRGPRRD